MRESACINVFVLAVHLLSMCILGNFDCVIPCFILYCVMLLVGLFIGLASKIRDMRNYAIGLLTFSLLFYATVVHQRVNKEYLAHLVQPILAGLSILLLSSILNQNHITRIGDMFVLTAAFAVALAVTKIVPEFHYSIWIVPSLMGAALQMHKVYNSLLNPRAVRFL